MKTEEKTLTRGSPKLKGSVTSCSAGRLSQLMAGPYTRLLAEHEQAIADLYTLFADTFPKSDFWPASASDM